MQSCRVHSVVIVCLLIWRRSFDRCRLKVVYFGKMKANDESLRRNVRRLVRLIHYNDSEHEFVLTEANFMSVCY